ncbi:2-C-methyl-D-erythritol 4-phosphate cytidylyltransferase [Carboxylicivirga mesophila]|uniref:2-C-methyl-D-erythritol 4-phosphate cytidylyltransferase n=1 Tax=Carboxylicivirga mesophila TaxID=1166478 RepID=A0ABS5KI41_9BACT|nr:2-C-methyl-D-erythritol 4-phosphate cytidylyltransferase [Carboxylicivirga mesophila]MBS2214006.1 2-C-methyl-D-erythritol 4-phosphate cytidylyltransferase [Carboxylicivirga mesophila]
MTNYAIIVAGGSGTRMGSAIPKQFLEINGLPVLMHTINTFHNFDASLQLILVLPEDQIVYWQDLCQKHRFSVAHAITPGGATRFESVKNGLQLVKEPALVGIHDGVRPFVSPDTLKRCYHHAKALGNAIPVLDAFESIRQIEEDCSKALDRSTIKLVQTPQVFHTDCLLPAYNQPYTPLFTDDASVVEAYGRTIHLVAGNRENIKITTPFDLVLAEAFIKAGFEESKEEEEDEVPMNNA